MSFDNPGVLRFLFALSIPVLFIVIRYRRSRKRAALFAVAVPSGRRKPMLRELRLRLIISDVFFLLFTAFLIIALAGPRWGLRVVTDYRRGVDLILAFDLSRSMNVSDCDSGGLRVSRLERAVEIAGDLVFSLGDIRLGAAIGREKGILAVPLTYDTETIFSFLRGLDTQAISGRGTNLESLLEAASSSFQDSIPSRRGIVIFSDGEALSGSFEAAAERIRKAGITLWTVGLGSDEGGPVPFLTAGRGNAAQGSAAQRNAAQRNAAQGNAAEASSGEGGEAFLLSADGVPVISSRQAAMLRYGAERTGGVYVDGARIDAAQALASYINSVSAESRLSGYRREASPRWQIFILAAMAALCGSRLMGFRRRRQKRDYASAAKKMSALSVLFSVFLLGSCSKVQGKLLIMEGNFFNTRGFYNEAISFYLKALDYEAPYAEYGLGSAYFALEESGAALERYKAAGKDLEKLKPELHTELRYRIHYNTGIIHFEKGNYGEAARSFRDALKADGSRIEAKRNLELSLLTIARNPPPRETSSREQAENSHGGRGGSSTVLFNYLKEKEEEQWKSREWAGEGDYSGLDY